VITNQVADWHLFPHNVFLPVFYKNYQLFLCVQEANLQVARDNDLQAFDC